VNLTPLVASASNSGRALLTTGVMDMSFSSRLPEPAQPEIIK
jgi:hypothetical protein